MQGGDGGDRLPSKKTRKILFNVCENNSSDRKLIFYILVFTKTLLTLQRAY